MPTFGLQTLNYPAASALAESVFLHRVPMSPGDVYRKKAAELRALAAAEADPTRKADYLALSQSYLRLIEQAERNQRLDLSYETPPKSDDDDYSAQ